MEFTRILCPVFEVPLLLALGEVNFLDAHTELWSLGTTGKNKRKKHIQILLFWAIENAFSYGSGRWQFSLIISTNHRLFPHPWPSAPPFLLHQETSPNGVQLWNLNEDGRPMSRTEMLEAQTWKMKGHNSEEPSGKLQELEIQGGTLAMLPLFW